MDESIDLKQNLHEFAQQSLEYIRDQRIQTNPTPSLTVPGALPLTKAQLLSLLVGFCGIRIEWGATLGLAAQALRQQRTFTFVYTDPATCRSNYQTACVPEYAEITPFVVRVESETSAVLLYEPGFPEFDGIDLTAGVLLRVHAAILGASNHYYSRVDPACQEVPVAMIVSPYSTCAGGCTACSRYASDSFHKPNRDYVHEHIQQVAQDFEERRWNREDLWSVNITTGCQPSPDHELRMFENIICAYHENGFTNAHFHPYSFQISDREHMQALLRHRVIGHVGTLEMFSDVDRPQYWGRVKGRRTFADYLREYDLAHEVGYEIVEANYVVGTDSYDDMLRGAMVLAEAQVALVPNIIRNYTAHMLRTVVHPDVWLMGFRYIHDGFTAALDTYRHPTIKGFAGRKTVQYLQRTNDQVQFEDLPIRHT